MHHPANAFNVVVCWYHQFSTLLSSLPKGLVVADFLMHTRLLAVASMTICIKGLFRKG